MSLGSRSDLCRLEIIYRMKEVGEVKIRAVKLHPVVSALVRLFFKKSILK
jgi:hypothetical protein